MGTFNSSAEFKTSYANIDVIMEETAKHFYEKGYETKVQDLGYGKMLSITKGGAFKAALGMKTALNIEVRRGDDCIKVEAKAGVFGQQVLPTLGSLFVAWPILITQISGLIEQSGLDEEALKMIEHVIRTHENEKIE